MPMVRPMSPAGILPGEGRRSVQHGLANTRLHREGALDAFSFRAQASCPAELPEGAQATAGDDVPRFLVEVTRPATRPVRTWQGRPDGGGDEHRPGRDLRVGGRPLQPGELPLLDMHLTGVTLRIARDNVRARTPGKAISHVIDGEDLTTALSEKRLKPVLVQAEARPQPRPATSPRNAMHTSLNEPSATGTQPATAEELEHQKAAITRLGHELRVLVEAAVRTAASPDTLHRVADGVRHVTGQLTGRRRTRAEIPEVDEFPTGPRMYSPVTGPGSPLAPPVRVTPSDDGLVGHCTLGIAHEGPPGYSHGGMSAMLLDELMGRACTAAGSPGLTVSLQMRYHQPVPLETPLRILARVTGTDNRKIFVNGSITTRADPVVDLVTADAVFVTPDLDRTRALFPGLDRRT
ncbi:PaaI family thioesterase [Streptomyces sp. T028]|uniref:PaaI family thioesterase n=1 Tax=Streptomyces sp. T028 TaxID=3394379 RepID=UPI003A8417D0